MGGICTKQPIVKNELTSKLSIIKQKEYLDKNENLEVTTKTRQPPLRSEKYQIIQEDEDYDEENSNYRNRCEENLVLNLNGNRKSESLPNMPVWYDAKYNYEFIKGECIGTGKLGSVYSGLSLNTGEIVAIKSVKLYNGQNKEKQVFDINQAVYKIGQINNKNIIKYICTQPSENPDEIDVICEFCNGGSIKQLLEKFDSFDEKLIRLYVKQILEGLTYLHEKNIVHRNIKNCNILIDGNGTVKLSDFVVSNILMGDDPETILFFNTNNGVDPPYWMSPEIINKESNLTSAVDIWSLGCIIIEMATKNPPWSNISTDCQQVIILIANSKAPPKFPSHVSKNLKSFLTCCLQHDPTRRPSAKELLNHKFFDSKQEDSIPKPFIKKDDLNILKIKQIESDRKVLPIISNVESLSKVLTSKKKDPINLGHNQKLIKKKNFQIVDKENKIEDKEKNLVNIIGNDAGAGAYFSVSMTVYSQQSIIPQMHEIANALKDSKESKEIKDLKENKDLKICPSYKTKENEQILEAFYDQEFSPLPENNNPKNFFKFNSIVMNNPAPDVGNESMDSIQRLIEAYNLIDINFSKMDPIEKLSTLEINKDDLLRLEVFFKEKNNKNSIDPIETNSIQNYLQNNKPL